MRMGHVHTGAANEAEVVVEVVVGKMSQANALPAGNDARKSKLAAELLSHMAHVSQRAGRTLCFFRCGGSGSYPK